MKIATSLARMEDEASVEASSVPIGTVTSTNPTATVTSPSTAMISSTKFDEAFYPGRRLTATIFKGCLWVHVREYNDLNGKSYPTKKGASFTPGRLRVFRSMMDKIDTVLRQQEVNGSYGVDLGGGVMLKEHLGGGIYATVCEAFHGVTLRRHWMPPDGNGSIVPTKNGIYLPASQWESLKAKMDALLAACPELVNPGHCSDTHYNQMAMLECRECTPFGWLSL